jgi:hypothetical protein
MRRAIEHVIAGFQGFVNGLDLRQKSYPLCRKGILVILDLDENSNLNDPNHRSSPKIQV